jgi:uncharacterized membrane protein YfcA
MFGGNGCIGQDHMTALSCALVAAALAGFSRGFAAFGAAMIYVPLVTLAYDAKTAVVTLFLVDLVPSLPLVWTAAPRCDTRTIMWMAVGAVALSPIGVALLLIADPAQSQLIMGVVLLAAVTYMIFKRGFRIGATPLKSIAAGAASGLAGGLCGLFGPPAMIYLLARDSDARRSRADTIVYLTGESIVLGLTYLICGMYTRWYLELAVLLMPVYGLSLWYGANRFSRIGDVLYRRIVLGLLCAVSALLVGKALWALIDGI